MRYGIESDAMNHATDRNVIQLQLDVAFLQAELRHFSRAIRRKDFDAYDSRLAGFRLFSHELFRITAGFGERPEVLSDADNTPEKLPLVGGVLKSGDLSQAV